MKKKSFRANNPAAVFDTLDLQDNSQPVSADNLPVGMRDSSFASGIPRDQQLGRLYLFNATSYISVGANNGDISSVSALDETGGIVALALVYSVDHYEITGIDGGSYWNIKCWANGVTPSDAQKKSYTLRGSGGQSNLFAWWKGAQGSGDVAIDNSGNENNGDIINLYPDFHATSPFIKSWQNEVGYTESDGLTYYYDQALTQLVPQGVLIPRDESIVLPPFKCCAYVAGGVQADLQYIGLNPTKAEFKGGRCFEGDSAGRLNPTTVIGLTNAQGSVGGFSVRIRRSDGISAIGSGVNLVGDPDSTFRRFSTATGDTDGGIDFYVGGSGASLRSAEGRDILQSSNHVYLEYNKLAGNGEHSLLLRDLISGEEAYIYRDDIYLGNNNILPPFESLTGQTASLVLGAQIFDYKIWDDTYTYHYPLSEKIMDAGNHTAYDVSGNGNHATLTNGSVANDGIQDEFFYDQLGILDDGINQQVPILADMSAFADGTPLTDANAILQDGNSFLNTGTKLSVVPTPRIVASDTNNHLVDTNGDAIEKDFADFNGVETDDYLFEDISQTNKITNFRLHPSTLERAKLDTEKRITNN